MVHDIKVVVDTRPGYKEKTEAHNDKDWLGQASAPYSEHHSTHGGH